MIGLCLCLLIQIPANDKGNLQILLNADLGSALSGETKSSVTIEDSKLELYMTNPPKRKARRIWMRTLKAHNEQSRIAGLSSLRQVSAAPVQEI